MIAGAYQRKGFGGEAFARLAQHFRDDLGWTQLRIGVLYQNAPALAFWQHLGFGFHQVIGADATNSNGLPTMTMEYVLNTPYRRC